MNIEERKQFAKQLKTANEMIYSNSPTSQQLEFFTKVIEQYDYSQLVSALNQHCQRSKFAPKPADLIEIINGNADQLKDQGAQCWAKIRKAVCHGHADKDVFFDDWRAMVALSGYWKSICKAAKTSYEALDGLKYDFIRAYVQAIPENAVTGFVESSMNETGQRRYLLCSEDTNNVPTLINEAGCLQVPQQRIEALLSHIEQVKLLENKQ